MNQLTWRLLIILIASGVALSVFIPWKATQQTLGMADQLIQTAIFVVAVILLSLVGMELLLPGKRKKEQAAIEQPGTPEERIEFGEEEFVRVRGGWLYILEEGLAFVAETAVFNPASRAFEHKSDIPVIVGSIAAFLFIFAISVFSQVYIISCIYGIGLVFFLARLLTRKKGAALVFYPRSVIREIKCVQRTILIGCSVEEGPREDRYRPLGSTCDGVRTLFFQKDYVIDGQ